MWSSPEVPHLLELLLVQTECLGWDLAKGGETVTGRGRKHAEFIVSLDLNEVVLHHAVLKPLVALAQSRARRVHHDVHER